MIKHFTELISKMVTLPFTEYLFISNQNLLKPVPKNKNKYEDYEKLKKEIQNILVGKYHVRSLDTINLLFEQYFPLKNFNITHSEDEIYLNHLNKLSKSFISHRNGKITLKYWKNENDDLLFGAFGDFKKIELWNSFSRIFCIDILVILHLLNNNMDKAEYLNGYYWLINLGDMQLDKILERGLAETHIHISVGVNFNMIWQEIMNVNLEKSKSKLNSSWKILKIPHIEQLLKMCGIVRVILYKYVISGYTKNIEEYLESYEDYLDIISKQKEYEEMKNMLKWFQNPINNPPEINYKILYKYVIADINFDNTDHTNQAEEIIKVISNNEYLHTTDENIFLLDVMKKLRSNVQSNQIDDIFSRLFWQYIRIKNIIYQGVTQANQMEGLDYFRQFFSRSKSVTPSELEHAICNQIYNNNLKKLEIRVPPSISETLHQIKIDLKSNLTIFFKTYKKIIEDGKIPYTKIPQIGIVYHFIKQQDDNFFEKCWYSDVTRKSLKRENYFYGKLQNKYKETIDAINELRETIPNISKYIVGLDAASLENSTEPWVFAPVYRHARDSNNSKMMLLHNMQSINTLGFTYHVGEEFRHLLSGIRHIDEVIEHFNYHVADRIGHGIAIGIDAKSWCENNPVTVLPRIEYMENLLWLWGQAFLEKNQALDIDLLGIEREIMLQAEQIYHNLDGITLFNLWKAYQGKFNPFQTDEKYIFDMCVTETNSTKYWRNEYETPIEHFCKQPSGLGAMWNESKLIHANHCKCFLERMHEVIQITVSDFEEILLEKLQAYVRQKLSKKGIVIETNPTSNLAISGIENLFQHPIMNMNTKGLEYHNESGKGLVITINSDDPAIFNTSISNELSYIFYLLQDKGYPRDSILEWINKIREWGIMTSFIIDREISKTDLIKEIDDILLRLK